MSTDRHVIIIITITITTTTTIIIIIIIMIMIIMIIGFIRVRHKIITANPVVYIVALVY